jgi:hypothetical protein
LKGFLMKSLLRLLLTLFTVITLTGCGADDAPDFIVDPLNDLPDHQYWRSANAYRFENGNWNRFITLGQVSFTPTLGDRPVILVHGLGGSIIDNDFGPLAAFLLQTNLATDVIGFEYDSQDSIPTNGDFLRSMIGTLAAQNPDRTFTIIGHSMGGLVARAAIQGGTLPIAATGNNLITLGTPHLGSPIASAIQDTTDLPQRTAVLSILNDGGFRNSDGTPSEVDIYSPGITELRPESTVLQSLNANIGNHPQFNYFTIAGTAQGDLAFANTVFGVSTDDGLVTVESANTALLNQVGTAAVPVEHTDLDEDASVFTLIQQFLAP